MYDIHEPILLPYNTDEVVTQMFQSFVDGYGHLNKRWKEGNSTSNLLTD